KRKQVDVQLSPLKEENVSEVVHVQQENGGPKSVQHSSPKSSLPDAVPSNSAFEPELEEINIFHVGKMLRFMHIMDLCFFQQKIMTTQFKFEQFISLYSILLSNMHARTSITTFSENNKKLVGNMAKLLGLTSSEFQLGDSMIFLRLPAILALENSRSTFLERATPAVIKIQRAWPGLRLRIDVGKMRSIVKRIQSIWRARLFLKEKAKRDKLKRLLIGVCILGCEAIKFQHDGATSEVIIKMEK
ncbi:hypothetical protein IE077_003855, partial [Cardiosporidium cionae]